MPQQLLFGSNVDVHIRKQTLGWNIFDWWFQKGRRDDKTPFSCNTYIQMKDKVSQIQKRYRREAIENYFKSRRMQLMQYRERSALALRPPFNSVQHYNPSNGWKDMVLNGVSPSDQEAYNLLPSSRVQSDLDFQMNLSSIEAGEHYLNILVDGAPYQDLSQTVYFLGKLITKVLSPSFKLSFVDQKIQCRILLKILQQVKYYLEMGQQIFNCQPRNQMFSSNNKTKTILKNLFDEDYRLLLLKQDSGITSQLIDISYILCNSYMIYPNYQIVRYILTRIITRDNLILTELQQKRDNSHNIVFDEKIEELMMKFIIFFKIDESVNRKSKNVHHLQVIHQFYSFIEYKLVNVYEFIRNQEHPFDYQHINNTLYFTLTLLTEIVNKFKYSLKQEHWEQHNALTLVKPAIIDIIHDITLLHSRSVIVERESDEFILTIEETVSKIFRYVVEEKSNNKLSYNRHHHPLEEWRVGGDDGYLLEILNLIRQYLREIDQSAY